MPVFVHAGAYFMNRDEKAQVVEPIAAQIEGSEAIYAVDYRGLSVTQAAQLRSNLRETGASFRVVKNTLTLRAADRAGAESLKPLVTGVFERTISDLYRRWIPRRIQSVRARDN